MNKITYHNVHNKFKLNGFEFKKDDLQRVAYSFIKEGEDFEKSVGSFLLDWFDEKPYLEIETSGTTGQPKIIQVDKQAMVSSALATGDFFGLSSGDRVLHCLPTKYVAGKMMFVRGFILGLDMDFVAPSLKPLDGVEGEYDFCAMVPMQLKYSIDQLDRVKKVITGGVKVHKTLEDLIKDSGVKTEIYETYGMSETITHVAAKRLGEEAFTLLPNIEISQDDRECLEIVAPSISSEKIVTNDIVKILPDNTFVWIGRYDNIINSGGIKMIPEQLEEKLTDRIPRRYIIAGLPDSLLGHRVVLAIEGEPYELDKKEVFKGFKKYEIPKEIFFIRHFAETATGKIIRNESLEKFRY
ncbi:MAG: AMP-binding protein [Flavobacteriales bacterium]|nr:AMP-binding protein [Flavobacteriales bacterium]